jgi:flagellar motor switch protein FliM
MPEVLTQSQIDKLLSELAGESTDEVSLHLDEKKVRPYNFRNPKKLTRDQQKVFRNIGEVFARHLASYLAGLTRTYCEVSVASLEEYPYKEYNNALPDMQVTGVLDVNLTKGAMLMDLSNSITFALIGRMFGGPVTEQEPPAREFTDIEVALMERIIRRITLLFQETWTFFPDMSMNLRQIETNTRFIKAIGMDDMVTSLVLAITLNQVKGTLTCCVPCVGILPVLDEIVSEQGGGAASADTEERLAEARSTVLSELQEATVDVSGILGSTTMTMREILDLQPGDVIRLDQSVGSQVVITVNGHNRFYGSPGVRKNKMALRINRQYAV